MQIQKDSHTFKSPLRINSQHINFFIANQHLICTSIVLPQKHSLNRLYMKSEKSSSIRPPPHTLDVRSIRESFVKK